MATVTRKPVRRTPPHRRKTRRTHFAELRRARIIAALIDCLKDTPAPKVTVETIVRRARVSRTTFYALFSDREDCFLGAFETTSEDLGQLMFAAFASEPAWRDATRAALHTLLIEFDADRGRAKLCVVDALSAGEKVLRRRAEFFDTVAAAIDMGRSAGDAAGHDPAPLTAEALVGATCAILHARVASKDNQPLTTLIDPLMSMIVLPYLGPHAAREEMMRATPTPRRATPAGKTPNVEPDLLAGLTVRVTHRTMAVLDAVAGRPGASNRQIATASGIADQGQISKLLNRLRRAGVMANDGAGHLSGTANSWRLTPTGEALQRATSRR